MTLDTSCMLVTETGELGYYHELEAIFHRKKRTVFEKEMGKFVDFEDYIESLEYYNEFTMTTKKGRIVNAQNYNIEIALNFDDCQVLLSKLVSKTQQKTQKVQQKISIKIFGGEKQRGEIGGNVVGCSILNNYKINTVKISIDFKEFVYSLKQVKKGDLVYVNIKNDLSHVYFEYSERCYVILSRC